MDLARIADELAIRELVDRYADAVNCVDAEAWGATWAPDGVWDLSGHEVSGRDALVPFWKQAMSGFSPAIQLVHSGWCDVDGDTATGRWWLIERLWPASGEGDATLVIGVYRDHYVRLDEGWRFARRRFDVAYRGPADLSADPLTLPNLEV